MTDMKKILLGALLLCTLTVYSQKSDSVKSESWKMFYRATATKINDLVNTKRNKMEQWVQKTIVILFFVLLKSR